MAYVRMSEDFEDEDKWTYYTHPIRDDIRYILWYFDKNGDKQVIKTTFDFHEIKWSVGSYHLTDPNNDKSKYLQTKCKALLTIEKLSNDNKWYIDQIYTRDKGKRVFIYGCFVI
jgi:hypothetical protein